MAWYMYGNLEKKVMIYCNQLSNVLLDFEPLNLCEVLPTMFYLTSYEHPILCSFLCAKLTKKMHLQRPRNHSSHAAPFIFRSRFLFTHCSEI